MSTLADTTRACRTLYLCYFGFHEPLVHTQVLPYLRELRRDGIEVSLLTFESNRKRRCCSRQAREWHSRLEADGIRWFSRTYHRRPSVPATLYDIAAGAMVASQLVRQCGIDVLHARGHVGAAMGAIAKRLSGGRLVFDIRGFMPEEYVDAGLWPAAGWIFRATKRVERQLLTAADGFVVLTEQAREILFPGCSDTDSLGRPVEVIPCCVDLDRFRAADAFAREQVRQALGISNRRVLVYVGSLGGSYLTEELAAFLAMAHRQDASTFSLILTQSPPALVAEPLRRRGVNPDDCLIRRVPPEEIPRYLQAADLALSFIRPCYSKLSSSPTKVAEYLASGLPVVCNAGIGDVDEVIEADRVGALVRRFHPEAYLHALQAAEALRAESDIAERCRTSARKQFCMEEVGGVRYRRLYRRLLEERAAAHTTTTVRS